MELFKWLQIFDSVWKVLLLESKRLKKYWKTPLLQARKNPHFLTFSGWNCISSNSRQMIL